MNDPYKTPLAANGPSAALAGPAQTRGGCARMLPWLALAAAVIVVPTCSLLGFFFYAGSKGPATSVYTGNEVPSRFIETMRDVGALDADEVLHYFYSDAMVDIKSGFYFVTNEKVGIYKQDAGTNPLTVVFFDEIADLELSRNESFFIDSEIVLQLEDGRPVSFPVSSDANGDERFFTAIEERVRPGSTSDRLGS